MKTIIIDENYKGLEKKGYYYQLDINIEAFECNVVIKIPLIISKSIYCESLEVGESLKVGEWLKVGESLKVGEWLKVGKSLEVGESLEVGKSLEVGEWLEVGKSLEVGEWLEVGESLEVGKSLEVGEWLEVGESLKVGEWLSIYGKKVSKYAWLSISTYCVMFTCKYIKIGCQIHQIKEWENFTDKEILAMDGRLALEWWRIWKDFIINTQKTLPEIYPMKGK